MKKCLLILSLIFILLSCENQEKKDKIHITTTINYYKNLIEEIGKDKVEVISLMSTSEDPHLYVAKPKDFNKLNNADIVIYSGLHLEGKIVDILKKTNGYRLSDSLSKEDIIGYDPHIWFSTENWKKMAKYVAKILSDYDNKNKKYYENNLDKYLLKIDNLKKDIENKISMIPEKSRILITAHDAFAYYAKQFGLEVKSIQGITTDSEASIKEVNDLAEFITNNKIKAVFVETSISHKSMKSLQEAVKSKGFDVKIGGELYSDSMGDDVNTYIKVMNHNTDEILKALK